MWKEKKTKTKTESGETQERVKNKKKQSLMKLDQWEEVKMPLYYNNKYFFDFNLYELI